MQEISTLNNKLQSISASLEEIQSKVLVQDENVSSSQRAFSSLHVGQMRALLLLLSCLLCALPLNRVRLNHEKVHRSINNELVLLDVLWTLFLCKTTTENAVRGCFLVLKTLIIMIQHIGNYFDWKFQLAQNHNHL